MDYYLIAYLDYLKNKKKSSTNTIEAYIRDLSALEDYMTSRAVKDLSTVKEEDVIGFLMDMKKKSAIFCNNNKKTCFHSWLL